MTINLTPEQESRLQAIMSRGVYTSVEEVVEAALAAVGTARASRVAGTPDELESLLSEGLASHELSEAQFWSSEPKKPTPCTAQIRPWFVEVISPGCQQQCCSPIPLLPRRPECSEIATRFTEALQRTIQKLREHPLVGARCRLGKPELENLRSWPVAGFESIRIYYLAYHDAIQVIRVLHGKRDLKRILERESSTQPRSGKQPHATPARRRAHETEPAESGRRCSCRSLAYPARRRPGLENHRLGHDGSSASKRIFLEPGPQGRVGGIHRGRVGRGGTRG